jgi:undecaprenyl-diphosphatase
MDWSLFHRINTFADRTGWAHGPMRAYAKYGIVIFGVLLIVAGLVSLRAGPKALARTVWAAIAPLVALILNQPIANAVDRARPYAAHPHVSVLISRSADPSFMSDHSVAAGAVVAGLCFVSLRIGLIAALFGLLMAFARVYAGAHYPGDVVAGLLFGAIVAAAGIPLVDRFLTPAVTRLLGTSLGRRLLPG